MEMYNKDNIYSYYICYISELFLFRVRDGVKQWIHGEYKIIYLYTLCAGTNLDSMDMCSL